MPTQKYCLNSIKHRNHSKKILTDLFQTLLKTKTILNSFPTSSKTTWPCANNNKTTKTIFNMIQVTIQSERNMLKTKEFKSYRKLENKKDSILSLHLDPIVRYDQFNENSGIRMN